MSVDQFKSWVKSGNTKKPLGGGIYEGDMTKKPSAVYNALAVARKYASGGRVGYEAGGVPGGWDWRSDMDAPAPFDIRRGEAPVLKEAQSGSVDTATEKALKHLLNYGPIPAKIATGIAAQPITAGEAAGRAAFDPTLANLTDAGVQTAMAAFQPMKALKLLGLGYGAAAAKDAGLLPFGEAKAQDQGLTPEDQKRLEFLRKRGNRLNAGQEAELASLLRRQEMFFDAQNRAKFQSGAEKSRIEAETAAAAEKAKSDELAATKAAERAQFKRAEDTAYRAKDEALAKNTSFKDSEVGKIYEKTGGYAPMLLGVAGGTAHKLASDYARRAAGKAVAGADDTFMNSYGKPAIEGTGLTFGAINAPLVFDSYSTPTKNPVKEAYETGALELPAGHEKKEAWAKHAAGMPELNPVQTKAWDELTSLPGMARRLGAAVVEGAPAGVFGKYLPPASQAIAGGTLRAIGSVPGQIMEGAARQRGRTELVRKDAAEARQLRDRSADDAVLVDRATSEAGRRTDQIGAGGGQTAIGDDIPRRLQSGEGASNPSKSLPPVTWPGTDIPLPPGVKLNVKGIPYDVHTGFPIKRRHYTGRSDEKKSGGAVAAALDTARRYASGGRVHVGPIDGDTGGRADKVPMDVMSGSYIWPADVVAGRGQGNTAAGQKFFDQLEANAMRNAGGRVPMARGGATPSVPIKAADGERCTAPHVVAAIGGGDMRRGHAICDALVKKFRDDDIKTLAALPPPSK